MTTSTQTITRDSLMSLETYAKARPEFRSKVIAHKRLRTVLIELSWRLLAYQSEYWLVKKWKHVLLNPRAHVRRRKQAIVAFARQLFIDLWKWKTGRATAQSLGWKLSQA